MSTQCASPVASPDLRLLVCDDTHHVRRALSDLLSLVDGLEVVGEAVDGRDAVEQALRLDPDVVVLDLHMPVMDGYEAAGRIKGEAPGCVLVALTA